MRWNRKQCFDCKLPFQGITLVCQNCADIRWKADGMDWLDNLVKEISIFDPDTDIDGSKRRAEKLETAKTRREEKKHKRRRLGGQDDMFTDD